MVDRRTTTEERHQNSENMHNISKFASSSMSSMRRRYIFKQRLNYSSFAPVIDLRWPFGTKQHVSYHVTALSDEMIRRNSLHRLNYSPPPWQVLKVHEFEPLERNVAIRTAN